MKTWWQSLRGWAELRAENVRLREEIRARDLRIVGLTTTLAELRAQLRRAFALLDIGRNEVAATVARLHAAEQNGKE